MKKQLLISAAAILLSTVNFQVQAQDPQSQATNTTNAPMAQDGCMGMMNGQNRMGMMNGQNRMGMMNGQNRMGMMNDGCMNMSMQRHRYVMQNGIDSSYQNKVNPYQSNSVDILQNGKALYEKNCAACHGTSGIGDGPAGVNLTPKPANIAAFSKMPMASDAYLHWTISEGGAPIQSPMPAFKSQLSEKQIWEIITYLRRL